MLYELTEDGKIIGQYIHPQPGLTLFAETHKSVKAALAIQADADAARVNAESAYSYARARAQAYVQAFSKDSRPNADDAMGHVLDAILSKLIDNDPAPLNAIATKRAEIKAAHPKA